MKNCLKLISLLLIVTFISCKKEKKADPPVPAEPGTLKIDFEHMVDASPLVFGQKFVSPKGDTFQVSKFNYFISNIVITNNDNSTWAEPESYHLVFHSDPASKTITIPNVPPASYRSITFMLGVDSARNRSGAQTGALDPAGTASNMYWNWNTGYIMFKLEGTSPKSADVNKILQYHIGGYGGVNKSQRNFTFNFSSTTANVSSVLNPVIHLSANVNELFKNPSLIDMAIEYYQVTPGTSAKKFADNYADIFTFKSVQN